MSAIDAVAVNIAAGVVLLSDDSIAPITDMIDITNELTDDPNLAVAAVCPLPDGTWLAFDLGAFERVPRH